MKQATNRMVKGPVSESTFKNDGPKKTGGNYPPVFRQFGREDGIVAGCQGISMEIRAKTTRMQRIPASRPGHAQPFQDLTRSASISVVCRDKPDAHRGNEHFSLRHQFPCIGKFDRFTRVIGNQPNFMRSIQHRRLNRRLVQRRTPSRSMLRSNAGFA